MSESKHTPGPWHTGTDEDSHIIYDANCGFVADAGRDDGNADAEEANARLIAAAPDLLAAIKELLERTERHCPGYLHGIKANARAAIAKAEGR